MTRVVFAAWKLPPDVDAPVDDTVLVDTAAAAETDVNYIMSRVGVPGVDQLLQSTLTTDQDFSHYRDMDLPAMIREVEAAVDDFAQLPPQIRQHFGDMSDFVDCLCNPARLGEAVAVGLYRVDESTGEVQTNSSKPPEVLDVSRPTDTTGVSTANGGGENG